MKILRCFLVMILCFGLLGCGSIHEEYAVQTTQTTEPSVAPTQGDTGGADVNLLGFGTLEEYERHFAENGGYPGSFITYKELQALGEFKGFVCQSYVVHKYSDRKEYTMYMYSFTVGEAEVSLRIYPAKYISESQKALVWEDATDTLVTSDLRINDTEALRARIMVADAEYCYLLSGKLHTISWTVGETEIVIAIPSMKSPWPENDPDTLIGRMLIWDTAEEALSELREITDGKLKDLKYSD